MTNELLRLVLASMVFVGWAASSAAQSPAPSLRGVSKHPMTLAATNLIPNRIYEMQKTDSVESTNWAGAGFLWEDGQGAEWRDESSSPKAFYRLKQTSRQLFESRVHIDNYLVYYGFWDETLIAKLRRYNLVVLNPNNGPSDLALQKTIVQSIRAGADGLVGTSDDVLLLGYVSMGEDQRTFNHAPADPGDGSGPCYFDKRTGQVVYEHNGYASYYLDEWDLAGPPGGNASEHDGIPDRNGDWGACYVNAMDPKWREIVIGAGRTDRPIGFDAIAKMVAFDGFFLDTPEVASPWERFGWTAPGIHDLIAKVRDIYPNKILLLNRGIFFFMPMYPVQYQWNPRRFIDAVLFESYYMDSSYGDNAYHINPYFNENRFVVSPKLNAELGRADSYCPILSMSYANNPALFPINFNNVYTNLLAQTVREQGRIEFISTRSVDNINSATIDSPALKDQEAPKWLNTCSGYLPGTIGDDLRYMSFGDTDTNSYPARIGTQQAVPMDGAVKLRWDVAIDQTRPVRYNIYISTSYSLDDADTTLITNAIPTLPDDYANRSFTFYDNNCPYEYTVRGLSNNTTYYFAVRAEDSTRGVVNPSGGRIGPSGGIEETNRFLLPASPRRGVIPIAIDGKFDDWAQVPAFLDATNDAPGGEVDWVRCKITDDLEAVYIYFQCAANIALSDRHVIYFNTDRKSHTGYVTQKGADYMFMGGYLYRYTGRGEDWSWKFIKRADYAVSQDGIEIELAKNDIQATTFGGGLDFFLYGDNSIGAIDYMPDAGCAGFSYTYLVSPRDATPPEFDTNSLAATDAAIDGVVQLNWSSATDANGPVLYEVLRDGVIVTSTYKTQIFLTGLSNGVQSVFSIMASDKLGNKTTSISRSVAATKDTVPPVWVGAPGIQKVIAQDGMAKLYWNKANDENHPPARFNIYYDTTDIQSYPAARKIGRVALSVSDDSKYAWMCQVPQLENNRRYCFAVRSEDRLGNEDANTNRILATVQAPLRLSTNTMDGAFGDWANDPGVVSCGLDIIGDGAGGAPRADIVETWLANDATHLFVRWGLHGEAAPSLYDYILFFDTDRNAATGYLTDWQTIGADYMAMNGALYRYTGTGGDWSWVLMPDRLFFSPESMAKNNIELAIPRAAIGAEAVGKQIAVWFYIGDQDNATLDDAFPAYGAGGANCVFK